MNDASLIQWADRWGIPSGALSELHYLTAADAAGARSIPANLDSRTEAGVMSTIALEAAQKGVVLWRNNVGAGKFVDDDHPERPARYVRFGLANDSKQLNKRLKSSDLIGWRPVTITPVHVGRTIAQFVARECKAPGWKFTGTDREVAQQRFIELVTLAGGDAAFASDVGSL